MSSNKTIRPDGIYTPVVPPYVPPVEKEGVERGTASSINRAAPREKLLNVSGFGEVVPVLYGEDRIGGVFIAGPVVVDNHYICALAWSAANEHGIEGVQSVIVNGSVFTPSGTSKVTHYNGTQNSIDPTLAASIDGFDSNYNGIAYSVFKIARIQSQGVPRIEAVVRGMKFFDVRTGLVVFSENPAMHLQDYITNENYGAGETVRNAMECINHCDLLLGGEPLCRSSIYINTAEYLPAHLDMFAAYAELIWSFDGSGISVVPDYIVDESTILDISTSDIKRDTLRLSSSDINSIPTRVSVVYTQRASWTTAVESSDAAGVITGQIEIVNSELKLHGIYRKDEAKRKSAMRLARLSSPARIAFQVFDSGIKLQRGDVVRLPDTLGLGADYKVRVMSNELVSVGEYQIIAEPYSKSFYSSALEPPPSPAFLPAGVIIPYFGEGVPANFDAFNSADGYFLKGSASESGAVDYANDPQTVTGVTDTRGQHAHDYSQMGVATSGNGDYVSRDRDSGGHWHTYSALLTMKDTPKRNELRLIKSNKETLVPVAAGFFALSELIDQNLESYTSNLGVLIGAGDGILAGGNDLTRSIVDYSVSTNTAGLHSHVVYTGFSMGFDYNVLVPDSDNSYDGSHSHIFSGQSLASIKMDETRVAIYIASQLSLLGSKVVAGYDGEIIPNGWRVCAELDGKFLRLSSPAQAGSTLSTEKSTLTFNTNTEWHAHSQKVVDVVEVSHRVIQDTSSYESHFHTISIPLPDSFQLPHYKMVFIEYIGE